MFPLKIGIICPSEIAFRRFMPSLTTLPELFSFVGIAIANPREWFSESNVASSQINEQQERELAKAQKFTNEYGGVIFNSYEALIRSTDIDAVYLPLPPALHYKWARLALENGKHVLVEKPSTTCLHDTMELISLAKSKKLALHENYMFVFHKQIATIRDVIRDGKSIGNPCLYRITFGFPRRPANDFRYNKALGGGALLDAGGYTLKYATVLLGEDARLTTANVNYNDDFEVEIFGTATVVGNDGIVAQLAFGMDNDYRCDIEVWGTKGTLTSNRILTAPAGFVPKYTLKQNQEYRDYQLPEDDAFAESLKHFALCIKDENTRCLNYNTMHLQASFVHQFKQLSGMIL